MHGSEAANFHYTHAVARLSGPGDMKRGREGSWQPLYQVQPWNEASCQRVSDKWSPQLAGARFQGQRVGKDEHSSMESPPHLWAGFSSSTHSLKSGGVTEMDSNRHGNLKSPKGRVTDAFLRRPLRVFPSWCHPLVQSSPFECGQDL